MSLKEKISNLKKDAKSKKVKEKEERAVLLDSIIDSLEGYYGPFNNESSQENIIIKEDNSKNIVNLDDEVDKFIEWYFNNMVKGHYSEIGQYNKRNEMRNLIEKVAIWYELRYPEYEINRLMPGSGQEIMEINSVMFKDNKYITDLLENDTDIKDLDWDEFYNTEAFINSLPGEERKVFTVPNCLELTNGDIYLQINAEGIIQKAKKLDLLYIAEHESDIPNVDKYFEGKHIDELLKYLKVNFGDFGVHISLERIVTDYQNQVYQREEMLNCVMYRIIERGGNRIGPRRAFLFAKEFDLNKDIPMMYGVDCSDPGLRLFINEYLKAGGSKDLVCYDGYFSKTSKYDSLNTISIQELLLTQSNNALSFYTPEEDELHQRLVNVLASQINVERKEVKSLRLKRKIIIKNK